MRLVRVLISLAFAACLAACSPQAKPRAASPAVQLTNTVCPVMGGPANAEYHATWHGRTVYFCCPSCVAYFQKDPVKYLQVLDQQAQPGVQPPAR